MPKAFRRRTHRSTLLRRYLRTDLPMIYYALIAILLGFSLAWILTTTIHITKSGFTITTPQEEYTVVGSPTINADFINQVLKHYHSPATGRGKTLYDEGMKYHIDPAFALAFFMEESTFGTQGVAQVTHSLGNIRATIGYPQYDGYRLYHSWEEGFDDWYQLIADLYVGQWGLSTVDQIIPVYAPDADNNNESVYIQTVKNAVDTWRNGTIEV
ncbi:MAG: hypothetical protein NVS4B11_22230 [Ktedonobacteraceae bacterium]